MAYQPKSRFNPEPVRNVFDIGFAGAHAFVPEIVEIANVFDSHIKRLKGLADLPVTMVGFTATYEDRDENWGYDVNAALMIVDEIAELDEGEPCSALMASLVSGAWSAFEILSGDLWETALNLRPMPLARDWAARAGKQQGKTIGVSLLGTYDLRKETGTMLRKEEKATFASLGATLANYVGAFGQPADSVLNDDGLRLLEHVRNLLEHKAGRVDDRFLENIRHLSHPFGTLTPTKLLPPFDAPVAVKLIRPAVERGVRLIGFVDQWIRANPMPV